MIKHNKKHIIGEKTCKCSHYDKTLSVKIYQNLHVKIHNNREKPQKCIYCDKVLSKTETHR